MKEADVTIGKEYDIKVGKNISAVRITQTIDGGWGAVGLSTGKTLVIKSAERLLGPHTPKANTTATLPPVATNNAAPSRPATTPKSTDTPPVKRASALDAAARVLAESKEPMNCRQLIETMTAKDYWQPSHAGKTPANTLHAAISKEIKVKGTDSRFKKAGRGQFALSSQ